MARYSEVCLDTSISQSIISDLYFECLLVILMHKSYKDYKMICLREYVECNNTNDRSISLTYLISDNKGRELTVHMTTCTDSINILGEQPISRMH